MCVLFAFLLFTALLFGLGFALHVLWWIAFIFLIFWLIGLAIRPRGALVLLVTPQTPTWPPRGPGRGSPLYSTLPERCPSG